ncbi:MAG: helix-turn-helix domain-containing protein [Lachnospiraceae bacterium]|nr:helix-turn-helix domain-containing protein [Lachnospiraceae bacterium]
MDKAEILKLARKQTGLTQEQFAGYFSIPKRTYQDWEYGNRKMPDYLLRLMLYKLKMDEMTEDLTKYLPEE